MNQLIMFFYLSGAVAQDGRIEPGDMILQVNDISFENMSNDDAVKVLRESVMKPGFVFLLLTFCFVIKFDINFFKTN